MIPEDTHTRLVAVVNERLERARKLGGETWYPAYYSTMDEWRVRDRATQEPRCDAINGPHDQDERLANFLAANDPATVIRHCERDLKVLQRHVENERESEAAGLCAYGWHETWPCDEIRDLAYAYGVSLNDGNEEEHRG